MTVAYPLQWPVGKPRKKYPERSRFGERSIAAATAILQDELRRLGASSMVLSTNLKLRNDGLPLSQQAQPSDQGVAVYFLHRNKQMCFACDRWDRIQDNIYAVAMTIEALRGIERWGTGEMVQQAFSGFAALPPPSAENRRPWWDILECSAHSSTESVDVNYKKLALKHHPDRPTGSHDAFVELNNAYQEFNRERGLS